MKNNLISYIIFIITKLIYITTKKQIIIINKIPSSAFIYVAWHGNLLFQPYLFKLLKTKFNLYSMISTSKDGAIISKVYNLMGSYAIRGSSRNSPTKALIGAIKTIQNQDCIAITPDGPKGPIHSVASGVYSIAKKTEASIVINSIIPSNYWSLNSWDKFIIPKPFSTLNIYYETVNISALSKDEANQLLYNKLMKYAI